MKKIGAYVAKEVSLIHFGFSAVTRTNVEVRDGTT
jgi:hypothetical protein